MNKKRIAFLLPSNKKCGVHDYSLKLFFQIKKSSKLCNFRIDLVEYCSSNNLLYYFNLAKSLSKKYDLIHLQHEFALFGKFGIGFFFFLLGTNKPLVVTFHEFHPDGLIGLKERFLLLFKSKISRAIVLSDYAERNSSSFFNKPKIINTGFGVIPEKIRDSSKKKLVKKLVVHPGFIRLNKNQEFTLNLAKLMPDYKFILAGGGEGKYFEKISIVANSLPNVTISGFIPEKEYFRLLSSAEFIVLPYIGVIQSAAFFDALSLRKKIFCSNLDFFADFARKGICFCSPLHEKKFAQLIRNNPALNRQKVENYLLENSFECIALKNISVYGEILWEN